MAKYGIGAKVVDDAGDEGVVIDKAKGVRRIEYADTNYGKLWVNKGRLVPASDQEVALPADKVLAGQDVSENACGWVPKVGDRVRVVKHCNVDGHPLSLHAPIGSEHTIPIGATVTFTATGRLSAVNENGHMQVTFPGLPAARNSFALPADYVSLAN